MRGGRWRYLHVIQCHGELGFGDEGRNLQSDHIQVVHSQLIHGHVYHLLEHLRRVCATISLMRIDLGENEKSITHF